MTKDELFDSFIIEFFFFSFYKLFEQPKYSIILSNCEIFVFELVKQKKLIFQIVKFWKFYNF